MYVPVGKGKLIGPLYPSVPEAVDLGRAILPHISVPERFLEGLRHIIVIDWKAFHLVDIVESRPNGADRDLPNNSCISIIPICSSMHIELALSFFILLHISSVGSWEHGI